MSTIDKKLIVEYKDVSILINSTLLDTQDAWSKLDVIKSLQLERLKLEETIKETTCRVSLELLNDEYTDIEFRLQDAWGFERSIHWHKFWNRPKCSCAKLDNDDIYPSERGYYMSMDCLLHGA